MELSEKLKKGLRAVLGLSSEEPTQVVEEVQLADMKMEDGTTITSEDWSEGGAIFIKGEGEEENIKLPQGEYQIDGKTLVVKEDGIIASWGEAEATEEEATEEPSEEKKEEELMEEPTQEEVQEEVQEEAPEVDAQVQELIIVIASLEQRIAALEGGQELSEDTNEGEVNLSSEEAVVEEVKVEAKEEEEAQPIVHTPKDVAPKGNGLYFGKGSINY